LFWRRSVNQGLLQCVSDLVVTTVGLRLLKECGKRARARVTSVYSWEKIAQHMDGLYLFVLPGHAPEGRDYSGL
jgi:hypothetical protein